MVLVEQPTCADQAECRGHPGGDRDGRARDSHARRSSDLTAASQGSRRGRWLDDAGAARVGRDRASGRAQGRPCLARPPLRRTARRERPGRVRLKDRGRGGRGEACRAEARDGEHDQPEDREGHHVPEARSTLRRRRRTRPHPLLRPALSAIGHRMPWLLTAAGYAAEGGAVRRARDAVGGRPAHRRETKTRAEARDREPRPSDDSPGGYAGLRSMPAPDRRVYGLRRAC